MATDQATQTDTAADKEAEIYAKLLEQKAKLSRGVGLTLKGRIEEISEDRYIEGKAKKSGNPYAFYLRVLDVNVGLEENVAVKYQWDPKKDQPAPPVFKVGQLLETKFHEMREGYGGKIEITPTVESKGS